MRKERSSRECRTVVVVAVVVVAFCAVASAAQAAASPAWKLLAATGPTNLPPRQSEVQRVTVEAEGGHFAVENHVEGTGTPVAHEAALTVIAGSAVATIASVEAGASFEVGDRVTGEGFLSALPETTIVSCSPDCQTPGSTVTLSTPAEQSETSGSVTIYTKELTGVTPDLQVGDEVAGSVFEYFPPGTVVTAASAGAVTLSNPTTFEYFSFEGAIGLAITASTPAIPYDASAQVFEASLETLPAFTPGAVTVEGGPGGTAQHPYYITFGGAPLAETNVEPLPVDGAGLVGAHAQVGVITTVPGGPGTGEILIEAANIGGAQTLSSYTVELGPLPPGVVTSGHGEGPGWTCPGGAGETTVICTSTEIVPQLSPAQFLKIPVEVSTVPIGSYGADVKISGGNAAPASFQMPFEVSPRPAATGIQASWAGSFDDEGKEEVQAGGHPYSAMTFFLLNTVRNATGRVNLPGDPKNVFVDLPPGFAGDPMVTARCPQTQVANQFESPSCNKAMTVGVFEPYLSRVGQPLGHSVHIYNDVPPKGYAAEFTAEVGSPLQSLLASVRSSKDFGVTITAPNNPTFNKIYGAFAALEGFPPAANGKAFLRSPTDCAETARQAPTVKTTTQTWQEPVSFAPSETQVLPVVKGCQKLQFHPGFSFIPTTSQGSSGAGAIAGLHLPQEGLTVPGQLATPDLKKAVVTLPDGLALNPSSANGLEACSEAQIGYEGSGELPNPTRFNEDPSQCPNASKLGTFEISTPLLEEKVEGTIYLAAQEENPFNSLIALYLVVENERFGLTLKLPGEVKPDSKSGQLTATFDYNPQLPFEDLTLHFRGGGPRSELATPEVCSHYTTAGELTPWSAPESGPPAQIDEGGFTVASGCASSLSTRPFSPSFEAGTTGTQAGSYSPLVIKVNRKDGEQELTSLNFTLPEGLTGKLTGIPYCPEAAIKEAESKSGKAEQAQPSCPAASRIGSVDTSAGVGSEPIHVGGSVYLAGPYEGAPLSSVVITPAVAGPFDLGDVVVRAPLFIDPESTEITAKSDPIPTILRGIQLKVRSVSIYLDRSDFTLNPTSCEPTKVTASIAGSSGATASPSNRFQVGGCDKLKFKPKLKLSLIGSTKHVGHPALKAVLTYPQAGAYSNIARAQVNLPHSEFIDQGNLDKTCTRPILLAGNCPARSIYGKAKAWTPLLEKPLEGPVYLVGGYGYKLPALVAELNGQIRVVLKGKVDSGPNKGIRNTFEAVPDAPVSRFVLEMKGGPNYSLLVNSENLCKRPQRAIVRFTAQNGLVDQSKPSIANQCGKKSSAGRGKKKSGGGAKRK